MLLNWYLKKSSKKCIGTVCIPGNTDTCIFRVQCHIPQRWWTKMFQAHLTSGKRKAGSTLSGQRAAKAARAQTTGFRGWGKEGNGWGGGVGRVSLASVPLCPWSIYLFQKEKTELSRCWSLLEKNEQTLSIRPWDPSSYLQHCYQKFRAWRILTLIDLENICG